MKHGSVVSFENEGQEYFDYWEIAKIIIQSKPSFLGDSHFNQAKVEEYLESAETGIMLTGTPIFNMIFGK